MAILVDKRTRLIVQGLTGREGTFHAKACAAYGTQVMGGVTPGKGGTTHEGWALNVSGKGVRIILETSVELGAEYDLVVQDSAGEATSHRARVVWVQDEPDGVVAGLEFIV